MIVGKEMRDKRPSKRELFKKIGEAREILQEKQGLFANAAKAVGELFALDIGNTNEVWVLIRELLKEICPEDYCGSRPPQQSYEKVILGRELLAFCWRSSKLSKQMYIKFVLKNEQFYYVSLHQSRIKDKEGIY